MKDTEINKRKADALYSVYKQGLEEGRFVSLSDASRKIATYPAPCFFVSARQASLLVGRIISYVSLINLNKSGRRLAWCLYYRHKQYLAENPDTKLSRERIMELIVEEEAPEFYISPDGVRRILGKKIKSVRRNLGW